MTRFHQGTDMLGKPNVDILDDDDRFIAMTRDPKTAAGLTMALGALSALVAADNCNYMAETMRYEGYFDRARKALAMLGIGEPA